MFNKSHLRLVVTAMVLFSATGANAAFNALEDLCPYVGAEAQLRSMSFDRNHGANVFKKRFTQGNAFMGIRWNEYFGLELGYETSVKASRTVNLVPGQIAFGPTIEDLQTRYSTTRLYGPHANFLGYWPANCSNLDLIGTLGLVYLKAHLSSNLVVRGAAVATPPQPRTFKQTKLIARIGGGVQYAFSECIKTRGMVIWENTSRFNHMSVKELVSSNGYVKLKNSVIFSLGFSVHF